MHIPDGFLDAKTLVTTGALSAGGLAVAVRQVNRILPRDKIPLMGLSAAFVFAAQMLNFPVVGGTSGHLLGGVLVSVLLGPGRRIATLLVLMVEVLLVVMVVVVVGDTSDALRWCGVRLCDLPLGSNDCCRDCAGVSQRFFSRPGF